MTCFMIHAQTDEIEKVCEWDSQSNASPRHRSSRSLSGRVGHDDLFPRVKARFISWHPVKTSYVRNLKTSYLIVLVTDVSDPCFCFRVVMMRTLDHVVFAYFRRDEMLFYFSFEVAMEWIWDSLLRQFRLLVRVFRLCRRVRIIVYLCTT